MKMLHTQGKSRGQVLILGCVTMLILALMLMLSFNMSQAINEKIRLQNQADAQAYSSAIMEARALNTMAYANRAIAASMVAQTALHAWMALASQVVAIHQSFAEAFGIIAIEEAIWCATCCWPWCFSNCIHCWHAIQAVRVAAKHMKEARNHGKDIKGLEDTFNKRVKGFKFAMQALRVGEMSTAAQVGKEVGLEGSMLGKLKTDNAPKSTFTKLPMARSVWEFQCALEGIPLSVGGCRNGSAKSRQERSKLMHDTSNASRQKFERDPTLPWLLLAHPNEVPMINHLRGLQQNRGGHFFFYDLTARVEASKKPPAKRSQELKNAGGFTTDMILVAWHYHVFIVGPGWETAEIISEGKGGGNGKHGPSQAHRGSHKEMLSCSGEECFVNFRANSAESNDWGQPRTYGAVTQSLRELPDGADKPYEVNTNGEVSVELVRGQQAKVRLVPQGTATAVAKGQVYYHQLTNPNNSSGGWKHAPNMFDPFWRAKLNSFSRAELIQTLTIAGDMKGAAIAATGPVEGR